MTHTFVRESFFSVPPQQLFDFHERADAFRLLTPDFAGVEVESTASTLRPSDEVVRFTTRLLSVPLRFEMVHTEYDAPRLFVDEQRQGPFRSWRHEHRFAAGGWQGDPAAMLRDQIEFAHPLGWLAVPVVVGRLRKLFAFRHETTRRHTPPAPLLGPTGSPLRVVLTGATGLIGRRISAILVEKGARVVALCRSPERAARALGSEVTLEPWDFSRPEIGRWRERLGEADAVIHLAGTPLFSRRWTPEFKQEMERSRVASTRQLVEAMGQARQRPGCLVSASAVGIYGLAPEREVDEQAPAADDTLARICRAWEAEALRAAELGIRTALVRTGIVLSTESGALKEMLPLFRLGLGGVLGERRPWVSWIHLEDAARLYLMAVLHPQARGPINAVAPEPVRNERLAETLAKVLRRPCALRYPTALMRLGIGEAADFASGGPRVLSQRAQSLGYEFFFPELEPALRNVLSRPGR
jgi:uncharacterized protein